MSFIKLFFIMSIISAVFYGCGSTAGKSSYKSSSVISADTIISDEQIGFVNNGTSDYILNSESNTSISIVGAADPELILIVGKRYEISVINYISHPLEIVDINNNILLSMGSNNGSYESDSSINFIDNGSGKIAFTFTQHLAHMADKYRCAVHTSTMTGYIIAAN